MIDTNIKNLTENFDKLVSSCAKNSEIVRVHTDDGNVILLSEANYNTLIESLYLAKAKGVYDDIKKAIETPTDSFEKHSPFN